MPMHSMTAYGYGEQEAEGLTYTCEIRSLNSRYLEVNARLPRHLLALEVDILNHVKSALRRGKVDVFVDVVRPGQAKELPGLDEDVVLHVLAMAKSVAHAVQSHGLDRLAPLSFSDFTRIEGAISTDKGRRGGPEQAESHRPALFAALTKALASTSSARAKEGSALRVALDALLEELESRRVLVGEQRDQVLSTLSATVTKRIDGVLATLAKSGSAASPALTAERLAMEVAMASDKADIDEELTRLATHIREFRRLMSEADSNGRKLDFLCQEMHREVNTMSNKLVQTEVSRHTLEMKQVIERLRQQVQNIE